MDGKGKRLPLPRRRQSWSDRQARCLGGAQADLVDRANRYADPSSDQSCSNAEFDIGSGTLSSEPATRCSEGRCQLSPASPWSSRVLSDDTREMVGGLYSRLEISLRAGHTIKLPGRTMAINRCAIRLAKSFREPHGTNTVDACSIRPSIMQLRVRVLAGSLNEFRSFLSLRVRVLCKVEACSRSQFAVMAQDAAEVPMSADGPWLNVPQAVVLEATRDIKLALDLTEDDPVLLVIKANQRIALRTVIPLEEGANNEQRRDAFRRMRDERAAARDSDRYLEAQQRVHRRLLAGVRTKASRTPGGPCESVDLVEFTRVELRGVDAIGKRTEAVMLYDLRINGFDLIGHLWGRATSSADADSSQNTGQIHAHSSHEFEKWDCAGDPMPKVIDWARSRWGENTQTLPSRPDLLLIFRGQFGRVLGINEKTMREVRRRLAPQKVRRGGAPSHRR
jgi:hypothetical protein